MTGVVPSASLDAPAPGADPDDMLGVVEATPDQWRSAIAIASAIPDGSADRPQQVVVAGMGGSGIAGDIAALIGARYATVPVASIHGDRLPAWIGPQTLVVLVSHSGGTAETLACAAQADAAGARIAAVTSGGALGRQVADAGGTIIEVPARFQPRASIALLTAPVLGLLERAGVIAGVGRQLGAIPDHLDALAQRWGHRSPAGHNEAKQLAMAIGPRLPWFLGAGDLAGVVALRARNQVAENAERAGAASELPEADHNELVGWAGTGVADGALVVLREPDEPAHLARRVAATVELAAPGFAAVVEHRLVGDSDLQRLAAGILFVDFVSVYLALLAGVDPTPVSAIEQLKRHL